MDQVTKKDRLTESEAPSNLSEDQSRSSGRKFLRVIAIGILIFFLGLAFFYFSFPPEAERTNLIVLGVTGGNHAGGDLTDTMIFFSLDYQSGKVVALSLPRDIWITPLRTKLNAAYHYGGFDLTKSTVAEILGQKVDYAVLVDSKLFVEAIDTLGGLEVEVARSLDDYRYPIPGKETDECNGDLEYQCRYEHLHFEAGRQLMNGERALKYVRSRNAEGEEGTDFARTKRQENLILAVKNKLLSSQFLLQPKKAIQLFKVLSSNIKTDLPKDKWPDFLKLALRFRSKNLKTFVLDGGFLVNPPNSKARYDNQWVLVPKAGDWQEVQDYVRGLINN